MDGKKVQIMSGRAYWRMAFSQDGRLISPSTNRSETLSCRQHLLRPMVS
jgi:hypothetical protein